jgi:hypothetical protein
MLKNIRLGSSLENQVGSRLPGQMAPSGSCPVAAPVPDSAMQESSRSVATHQPMYACPPTNHSVRVCS